MKIAIVSVNDKWVDGGDERPEDGDFLRHIARGK